MTEALIINAFYSHRGEVMIASSETDLTQVALSGVLKWTPDNATVLLSRPGSDAWIDRMVRLRNALVQDLTNKRAELERRKTYIENLGNAILEQANAQDWCEEYDEFAREWGLPQRLREFEATITVRVLARDSEQAADLIKGELGIDSHTDCVVGEPEITAERVR